MGETIGISKKNLFKFITASGFGVFMFLIPVKIGENTNTIVGMLSNLIQNKGAAVFPVIIVIILTTSTLMSAISFFIKPFEKYPQIQKMFSVKPYELLTKFAGTLIAAMVLFKIGPAVLLDESTGKMMMDLGATLISIAISLSYILPFLTNTGIMEFIGVIGKPVVNPLFRVPGCASLDLITSWFGASSAAVIMTRKKYQCGYYTKRETAIIMTNFSLVSIPFCMVIAGMLGIEAYFPVFYSTICILGVILAVILPRIYPINRIPEEYYNNTPREMKEEVPANTGKLHYALLQSCRVAEEFKLVKVLTMGTDVMLGILFNLLPMVIAWGTAALILLEFTPLFQWLSWPIGWCLSQLGVEQAFTAAPATLAGFVDMFIPALLAASIESVKTRFIIGVLSLIQIIYLTEVGAVILQSQIGVDLKKLILIFLERTLISLPLIILIANIIFW